MNHASCALQLMGNTAPATSAGARCFREQAKQGSHLAARPGFVMELEGTGTKIKSFNQQHLIRSARKIGIPIEYLD